MSDDEKDSLLVKYQKLRQSYHAVTATKTELPLGVKGSRDDVDCGEDDENEICLSERTLKSITRPKPPPPRSNVGSHYSVLIDPFLVQLKTSGLRAVREKALISKFNEIISAHEKTIFSLYSSVEEWSCYANQVSELSIETIDELEKELKDTISRNDEAELNELKIKEKYENIKTQLSLLESESKKNMEQKMRQREDIVQTNRTEMANFILQMEREIEIVKSEIEDESNRMQAKTRVLYEREKEKEICQLKESVNDLMNEKEIYREKLQCVEREAKLKEQKNIKAIEGKDGEIMELHTALSNIKVSLKEQESQNIELKTTLKGEKARQESEVEEMKKSRQQELDEIEGKVKNIVEDRDTRYQSALDRALCAEKELNRYETMFSNIEDGLGSVSREIIEGKDHY